MNDARSPSRFLVTGAGGFVGRGVSAALRRAGHVVTGADVRGADRVVNALDAAAVRALAVEARADVLVHAAALTTGARDDGLDVIEVNARGTMNALEAALDAGTPHFVLLSSAGVYAARPGSIAEDAVVDSGSPYALSKLVAEDAARLAARAGVSAWVLRVGPVIGPFERPSATRRNTSLAHRAATAALTGEPVTLPCRRTDQLDFLHVSDLAAALERIAQRAPQPACRVYNAAGPGVTALELRAALHALRPDAGVNALVSFAEDAPARRGPLDCSRLERDLGWRARVPLERALMDYLNAEVNE